MSSIQTYNQTGPFWDFIAELQEQGPAHPWFRRQRGANRHGEAADEARQGRRARLAQQIETQDAEMRDPSSETETGDETTAAAGEKTAVRDFQESDGEGLVSGDDGTRGPHGHWGGRFAGRGRGMGPGGRGRGGMGGRGGRGMGPGHHRHHHHHRPGHHIPSDGEDVMTGDEDPRGPGGRHGGWGGRGRGGGRHRERHGHGHDHGPRARGLGEASGDEGRLGMWAHGPHGRHGRRGMHPFGPMAPMFPGAFAGDGQAQPDGTEKKTKDKFRPAVDVFDHAEAFVVHVSLPGAKKKDIEVNWNAERSALQITGTIDRPGDEEVLKTIAMQERKVGPFERMVRLGSRANPAQVDVDSIAAKMEDGVLRIEVPKLDGGFVEVRKVDIA